MSFAKCLNPASCKDLGQTQASKLCIQHERLLSAGFTVLCRQSRFPNVVRAPIFLAWWSIHAFFMQKLQVDLSRMQRPLVNFNFLVRRCDLTSGEAVFVSILFDFRLQATPSRCSRTRSLNKRTRWAQAR